MADALKYGTGALAMLVAFSLGWLLPRSPSQPLESLTAKVVHANEIRLISPDGAHYVLITADNDKAAIFLGPTTSAKELGGIAISSSDATATREEASAIRVGVEPDEHLLLYTSGAKDDDVTASINFVDRKGKFKKRLDAK